jgi:predicted phage tail protein
MLVLLLYTFIFSTLWFVLLSLLILPSSGIVSDLMVQIGLSLILGVVTAALAYAATWK